MVEARGADIDVRTRPWLRQPGESEHEYMLRKATESAARDAEHAAAIEVHRQAGTLQPPPYGLFTFRDPQISLRNRHHV